MDGTAGNDCLLITLQINRRIDGDAAGNIARQMLGYLHDYLNPVHGRGFQNAVNIRDIGGAFEFHVNDGALD
jgi:hypothetical protein